MAVDLVTFNIRCEKSTFELKMKTPSDASEFNGKLKNEFELEDTDELIVLCPTPEGKMMEIKTDDDIEFLKKTKLCYNAVTKEINCSVELVAIIIHKQLPDDPKAQMMMLSNKVDQLASQFVELSLSLNNKIDENAFKNLNSLRLILLEYFQSDPNNASKKNSLGGKNNPNVCSLEPEFLSSGLRKKKSTKKEKLSSTSSSNTSTTNDNSSNSSENKRANIPKDIDTLLEMLVNDGFTNTIQNIIVLKRFDNDYEQAINHLKSCST